MRQLRGPAVVVKRRMIGGGIAGAGLALLAYQVWRLVDVVRVLGETSAVATPPHPGYGGIGTNLVLGLLGLVVGVAIGQGMGRRQRAPCQAERSAGVTIEGEGRRIHGEG